MRHFVNQLLDLGCIYRSSSEENESLHQLFKTAYVNTNRQLDKIHPKLHQATLNDTSLVHSSTDVTTYDEAV